MRLFQEGGVVSLCPHRGFGHKDVRVNIRSIIDASRKKPFRPASPAIANFPGPYALEALGLSVDVVLINLVPTSPVRGTIPPAARYRATEKCASQASFAASGTGLILLHR